MATNLLSDLRRTRLPFDPRYFPPRALACPGVVGRYHTFLDLGRRDGCLGAVPPRRLPEIQG